MTGVTGGDKGDRSDRGERGGRTERLQLNLKMGLITGLTCRDGSASKKKFFFLGHPNM